MVAFSATPYNESRPLKRTAAGDAGRRGECGSRGRGLVSFAPGRLRENARPALRPVCDNVAGLGQADADNSRVLAASQEVRLELSGGVGSLPQAPRWNAGRRAVPLGRAASAADDVRKFARSSAMRLVVTTRLPAFRLLLLPEASRKESFRRRNSF